MVNCFRKIFCRRQLLSPGISNPFQRDSRSWYLSSSKYIVTDFLLGQGEWEVALKKKLVESSAKTVGIFFSWYVSGGSVLLWCALQWRQSQNFTGMKSRTYRTFSLRNLRKNRGEIYQNTWKACLKKTVWVS